MADHSYLAVERGVVCISLGRLWITEGVYLAVNNTQDNNYRIEFIVKNMRNTFIDYLTKLAITNKKIFLLVGDVGYNVVEKFEKKF